MTADARPTGIAAAIGLTATPGRRARLAPTDRAIDGAAFDRAPGAGFVALLVAVTVFQRFGLNFGSYSLNAGLPAIYGLLVVAAFAGVAGGVAGRGSLLFAVCACLALLSTFAQRQQRRRASSLLLLLVDVSAVRVRADARQRPRPRTR